MDEHPNVTLVREGFDKLNEGDTQWLEDHLADDVVWHVGGNSSAAGPVRGKEAVLQMMTPTGSDVLQAEIHDVVGNEEHTVVLGSAKVSVPSGASVEYKFVQVFHVEDGKVTEAWGMAENDAAVDPIWEELASLNR